MHEITSIRGLFLSALLAGWLDIKAHVLVTSVDAGVLLVTVALAQSFRAQPGPQPGGVVVVRSLTFCYGFAEVLESSEPQATSPPPVTEGSHSRTGCMIPVCPLVCSAELDKGRSRADDFFAGYCAASFIIKALTGLGIQKARARSATCSLREAS